MLAGEIEEQASISLQVFRDGIADDLVMVRVLTTVAVIAFAGGQRSKEKKCE